MTFLVETAGRCRPPPRRVYTIGRIGSTRRRQGARHRVSVRRRIRGSGWNGLAFPDNPAARI